MLNQNDNDVVIIDGFRTPFVKATTLFKDLHVAELGHTCFKELLYRVNLSNGAVNNQIGNNISNHRIENHISEVIIGNAGSPPDTANLSRVVALRIGLSENVSAFTVHRNCASALESITCAVDRIRAGSIDCALVGGAESMSNYPLIFSKGLTEVFSHLFRSKTLSQKLKSLLKIRLKHFIPRIALVEGLTDPFVGLSMGQTAEVLSKEFGISRKEQDEFALKSHQKTIKAQKEGKLKEEIVPVTTEKEFVEEDHGPREDQSLEKLKKLRPYFDKKYGSVTVGNACPVTDGAVALLVMSRKKARSLGLQAQAVIRSYAYKGCSPKRMGLGPVFSTPLALKQAGLTLKDMDLIEINEAFSAQVLACMQAFSSRQFCKEHLDKHKLLERWIQKN